ncbi:hypothetical protein Nmel_009176 [Mimus melanotis]
MAILHFLILRLDITMNWFILKYLPRCQREGFQYELICDCVNVWLGSGYLF